MIGILGGTFDPIHFGHLRIGLDIVEHLQLDQLRLIPLNHAVHREQPFATPAQRLEMVKLAIAGEPRFVADDRELRREGASFTLDTLRSLRAELGGNEPICLLVGGDAFNQFLSWREPEQVAELAHIVVMQRPGYHLPTDPALQQFVERRRTDLVGDLRNRPGGHVHFHAVTQLEISSSDIRARIGKGRSPGYLIPRAVAEYIAEQGLYR